MIELIVDVTIAGRRAISKENATSKPTLTGPGIGSIGFRRGKQSALERGHVHQLELESQHDIDLPHDNFPNDQGRVQEVFEALVANFQVLGINLCTHSNHIPDTISECAFHDVFIRGSSLFLQA
jgi:hypothetical protein